MKKLLIVFILLGLLIGTAIANNETISNETQSIYNNIEKSSVQIFGIGNEGSFCTGTIIENNENAVVLTCKHCVGVNEETWADNLKTKLILVSAYDDLAYLVMDGYYFNKLPAILGKHNESIGNKIYIYGKPGNGLTYTSEGTVLRFTDDWTWAEMEAVPGSSGSGVFNKNLELIGVLWGGYHDRGKNIMVFEPLSDIIRFLKEVKEITK